MGAEEAGGYADGFAGNVEQGGLEGACCGGGADGEGVGGWIGGWREVAGGFEDISGGEGLE